MGKSKLKAIYKENKMLNILKELQKTQELAEIYTDGVADEFEVGNIVALNEEMVAFRSFAKNGDNIGIVAYAVEHIFQIRTKTKYLEKIEKIKENDFSEIAPKIDENNIIASILNIAFNEQKIVSVKLLESTDYSFTGFVDNINDNECRVKIIDEYGCEDGFGYSDIKDITEIAYMCEEERRCLRLWQYNQEDIKQKATT